MVHESLSNFLLEDAIEEMAIIIDPTETIIDQIETETTTEGHVTMIEEDEIETEAEETTEIETEIEEVEDATLTRVTVLLITPKTAS